MLSALFLSLMLAAPSVSGIVRDSTGGAVAGASVVIRTSSGTEQTVSGPDGRFTLNKTPDGQATLIVRAGGFAQKEQPVSGSGEIEVVLSPAGLLETVTVTASRREERLGNIPASISIIDSADIKQSPALVADDLLRRLPAFSLFRRTSSLSSHPTAQGVSLRGIGPSGVSRTLVMVDSVPFNDPFGGWVYWTRVPMGAVDRIEVVDGSSSSLYGNYAMGGVINIVSTRPTRRTVELKTQYGNLHTPKVDFFGSDVWGKLGVSVEGSAFDTDGFPIVIEAERRPSSVNPGPGVDTNAAVTFRNVNVKLDYTPTSRVNAFVRGGYFREERNNGKSSTIDGTPEANDTTWKFVSGGVRILLPDASDLQARVVYDDELFHSNFLAVPAPPAVPANALRSLGRMTLAQEVPAKNVAGMAQWSRGIGKMNFLGVGTDWRWVDGDSNEDALDTTRGQTVTLHRVSGGTQRSLGAFIQDVFTPVDKLVITASARVDNWRNYDSHSLETNIPAGTPGVGNRPELAERRDTVGSPRVAALYHLTNQVRVWGDVSTGFRAPTLNELYRQFRVGAILTLANDSLGPERLKGGELGISVEPMPNVTLRATFYDNRMKNPVSNVTIATNTQQRQNLGRTRIRGLQTDAEINVGSYVRLSGGYLYNDAKVTEFAANPTLVGRYLSQVPKHRGSFQISYSNPKLFNVGFGAQFFGRQFDDDQNVRVVPGETKPGLPEYSIVDLTASRAIGRNLEVFVGAQNILDKEYIVGTLPTTIGSPRLVNGGVRVHWSGR